MKRLTKTLAMATIAMLGCFHSAQAEEKASGAQTETLTQKALKHEKLGVTVESANHLFADKYPLQYNSWKATSESTDRGSALEADPRSVILWAGYSFSKEYNKPRGHYYAVTDVQFCVQGHRKMKMMARSQWHAGLVKGPMYLV